MSEILCSSPLIRGTEFILNDSGVRLFGTCGQRALASTASSQLGNDVSTLGIYDSMLSHSWCDVGGASTIGGLLNQAKQMNCAVAAFQPYGEPWNSWLPWLGQQIGEGNPVVLEVAAGQALVDKISGLGENAQNLQYHYIAVLGMDDAGFWCADGCSFAGGNSNANGFAAANVLQYYTDSVLQAARPCAALALKGRVQHVAWTKQSDGRGQDDQGHTCGQGDIDAILAAGLEGVDAFTSEIYPDENLVDGSLLPLENGAIVCYRKSVNRVSIATGSEDAAALVMETLKALDAAKASPAPSEPAPVSAQAQAALDAMAAIKAALAA